MTAVASAPGGTRPAVERGSVVPFLDRIDDSPEPRWYLKTEVGLRQLQRRPGAIWGRGGRVEFTVLDDFGYVAMLDHAGHDDGNPPRDHYAGPGPDRLVDREQPTDLASVPSVMWGIIASYGDHTMPALLHDTLCTKADAAIPRGRGRRLRREADQLFRTMLKVDAGVGIGTRWVMWTAVRLFASKVVGVPAALLAVSLPLAVLARTGHLPWAPLHAWAGIYSWAAVVSGVLLAVAAAWQSFEDNGFSAVALGGLLGASLIALVAVPPLAPALLLTVVTLLAMRLLDFVLFLLHAVLVRFPLRVASRLNMSGAEEAKRPGRFGSEPPPTNVVLPRG